MTEKIQQKAAEAAADAAKETAETKKVVENMGDDLMGQEGLNRKNPSQK